MTTLSAVSIQYRVTNRQPDRQTNGYRVISYII